MNISKQKLWARANAAFRKKDYETAITLYEEAINQAEEPLKTRIRFNHDLTLKRLGIKTYQGDTTPAVINPEKVDLDLKIKTRQGHQPQRSDRSTVLLVGHALGKEIFGGERSFLDMINGVNDLGYNVIITLPNSGNQAFIEIALKNSFSVCIFKYEQWRRNDVSELAVAAFSSIIVKHHVDIIHVNTIMLREPLLAAKLIGVPSIIHARELITHDKHLCEVIGEDPSTIVRAVEGGADYLIANSQATANCFSNAKNISIVPNTVDVDLFENVPKVTTTYKPLRVGLISSNLPKKGIYDFIEVAKSLERRAPDISFVLIGPVNDHINNISKDIKDGKLPKTIKLAGYIDNPVLAVAEADIVVNLSNFMESFGRTILEAMAAARPVIVYDWGALPELVDDGKTGYIVPFQDIAAVAERIYVLYKNRIALDAMGRQAQIRAKTVYGRTAYVKALKSTYDSILSTAALRIPEPTILRARNLPRKIPRDKLKIAYFCWHFPVPSETFVLNELRILKAQGIDVIVFCKQSPYPDFRPDFDIKWARVKDAEDLANLLIQTNRTIVHAHFVYPTVTDMVWPATEKAMIPFTCIAHAQDIFRYKNAKENRINEFSRSPWCKQIFTLSRFHREFLISQDVPADKLTINSNCIDPDLFVDGKIKDRPARSSRSICAVSRFAEKKGLEMLVRAGKFLLSDDITINIYGYGPQEDLYRQIIEDEAITNVKIYGAVESREALLKVFRKHDLFACPSVRASDGDMDGIPTTLMESMAAGLPVLSTPIAGIPDLVLNGITGLMCDIATPEAISAKIRDFYAMPDIAVKAMIEDAESLLRRNYHGIDLVDTLIRFWANETIDLTIVTLNNQPQTSEVIRRLYEYTRLPFHLIVCDNGSHPPTLAKLLECYGKRNNFTLILNHENSYVGPGTNLCIEQGNSEYIIYVCGKEGMTTNFGWDKSFVSYMNANPHVGLAGTLGSSPSYLYGKDYPRGISLFEKFRNKDFAISNPDRIFKHVQGGFFVIRRKAYSEIGGFSSDVPHSYTDVEYSHFMESCGWELGEVPRLMALYNKTRPSLESRVDESHAALHPPSLSDLHWLDRIARQEVRHCNVCGHQAKAFEGGDTLAICGNCGSTRRSRTIHRVLADSILLYRRLPALGTNIPIELQKFWGQQFQGKVLTQDKLFNILRKDGKLDNRNAALKLVFLNDTLDHPEMRDLVMGEVSRLLSSDGELYVVGNTPQLLIQRLLEANGFAHQCQIRYSSVVSRYDWAEIGHYRKERDLLY